MEFTVPISQQQRNEIRRTLDEWLRIARQQEKQKQDEEDLLRQNDEGPMPVKDK